ncbi:hypothetical protein ACLOJK_026036 [Asimina triloba]
MAFLFAHSDGAASNFPPLCFPLPTSLSVCDSCNGLLLLQQAFFDFGLPTLPMGYVVYNPATRNSVAIPFQSSAERDLLRVGFAFDGRCYRVIRVCGGSDAGTLEFEIFSSQTGEWRVKQLSIPDQQSAIYYALPPMHSNQSVFLKESLYWLLGKFLLIFHTKEESLMLVELPGRSNSGLSVDKCIWESEGCLNYCRCDKKGICVWALGAEDSKLEWRMKHRGSLEISPASEISSFSSSFEPCAFNDDFGTLYMHCNRRLFSYKIETGLLKEVSIDSLEASCAENICALYPFLYCTVDLPIFHARSLSIDFLVNKIPAGRSCSDGPRG